MSSVESTIKQFIRDMNAAWLEGRIDDLDSYFAKNVVLVPPGSQDRIVGREAMVESFRQYAEQATTHDFEETALLVDVMGTIAVATLQFRIHYEFEGHEYKEVGQEILILTRTEQGWQILWRTQIPGETKEVA